jgi:hypothetical protein
MRQSRRDPVRTTAAVCVVVGLLVTAFALANILFGGGEDTAAAADASSLPANPSVDTPAYAAPADGLGLGPTDESSPGAGGGGGAATFPGAGADLQGLGGKGGVKGLPVMRITMSMTSAAPIAYVGYVVPTSRDDATGTVMSPGTSWSLTTSGYGPPDYAQLFSLAGPAGVPITCTITVNGEVTEQRTTSGPYDQLFCQG